MKNACIQSNKCIFIVVWLCIAILFGCGPKEKIASGPFVIETYVEHSVHWRYEEGGHLFDWIPTTYFKIKCNGRPVKTPQESGVEEKFRQAFFLKDAPRPTVLAEGQEADLITEENGQERTQTLEDELGTYQWLDSENKQPGAFHDLHGPSPLPRDPFLAGGRWLLIDGRTVLDVQTLRDFHFDISTWDVVKQFGGYYANSTSAPGVPAVGFSPDQTQIAFVGAKRDYDTQTGFLYGLVVVDFAADKAYSVPFDRTDTRLPSTDDATPQWLATYFEWGKDRLTLRSLKQLPYWQGKISRSQDGPWAGHVSDYYLEPVKPTMLPKLVGFIKQECRVLNESTSSSENISWTTLKTDRGDLRAYFNPSEKKIGLSLDFDQETEASVAMLDRIVKAFNEELAKGNFQEEFGRF